MCPTLKKLGDWLVCSAPSDEKGGLYPFPTAEKPPQAALCLLPPCSEPSLGMWTLLLGWMYLETDALPKVCCLLWRKQSLMNFYV